MMLNIKDIKKMKNKIIAPVTGKTLEEIMEQAKAAVETNAADLIEWRADFYFFNKNLNKKNLLDALKNLREILGETPLIFTLRTKPEGGEININFKEYKELNLIAAQSGLVDIIDIEIINKNINNLISDIKNFSAVVIGSKHDFSATPEKDEIIKILLKAKNAGADILKAAFMPKKNRDVINLIAASAEFHEKYPDELILTISMGSLGMISRTALEISGSFATFGAVGNISAPGQIQAVELKKILDILKI